MTVVAIDKVSISSNRRPLKDQKVAELMQSIKVNGLLNPITLDQNLTLIAGLHRLTACKMLGLTQIECHVVTYTDKDQARLAEIDENLIRNELEIMERSELWLERDQILERMGLRARRGDNQHTHRKNESSGSEYSARHTRTTLELAQETGYSDRTFQQGKQIARDITPEVKAVVRGTPAANSSKLLLKVARAGGEERKQAEAAEQAAAVAREKRLNAEAEEQARIAAEARLKQTKIQLVALQSAQAAKETKLATKAKAQQKTQARGGTDSTSTRRLVRTQLDEAWSLNRHLVYCGDSASEDFVDFLPLPANAALAIAPLPSSRWNHDYLVDEAQVVAIMCPEDKIHEFCHSHRMPFQFEMLIGELYIALFSHQPLVKPEKPSGVEGIEGIATYLISFYTKPGQVVINPALGEGEVLIACERMGLICFACDDRPEHVNRTIDRWQKWTGRSAQKIDLLD
jgi:ParB family transcriptional regulator, chromosome partitioning protein